MPFRLVYHTADISALSRSILDSAEIYISCSVHKSEWHSVTWMIFHSDVIIIVEINRGVVAGADTGGVFYPSSTP